MLRVRVKDTVDAGAAARIGRDGRKERGVKVKAGIMVPVGVVYRDDRRVEAVIAAVGLLSHGRSLISSAEVSN